MVGVSTGFTPTYASSHLPGGMKTIPLRPPMQLNLYMPNLTTADKMVQQGTPNLTVLHTNPLLSQVTPSFPSLP